MDTVLAPLEVSLLVQHFVPSLTFAGDVVEEARVALRRNAVEQQLQCRPCRASNAELRRGAAPQHPRTFVDLDYGAFVGQEIGVRIVGSDHQQQLAALYGVVDRLGAYHAETAHPTWVVIGHQFLAAHRMDQGRLETIRKLSQEISSA